MSDIPTPRSYPQVLGDLVDAFLSSQGIHGLRFGSPILSILESAAQSDVRSSQDIFNLLSSISLDNATGVALLRIGQEEGVEQDTASPSTGAVTITDTSFTKLATRLFQGKPAPIVGSFKLNVSEASLWPASGQAYVGRGTSNYEGPLSWSAKTDMGTYWELTLTQPTTKVHNVGESVILAQGGNRVIGRETIVKTPQANVADAVQFRTASNATIPDGETVVTGVLVVCEKSGLIGRVPANAISQFATNPFAGATVTNSLPFSNGQETEDDDRYRERIRDARRNKTKGTARAIESSVTGITSFDESKKVTSTKLVVRTGFPTTLYIDDGTGYEERSTGVAVEVLVDSALGGEQYFQAKHRPIAKAFLLARNTAPYLLSPGGELKVRVGGSTYTHRFDDVDFTGITSASAYEVISSINANEHLGFFARVSNSGARVVLFSKGEDNEDLEIIGGDMTEAFRFPQGTAYSLQVYRNDRLLVKDGRQAVFASNLFGAWDSISGPQTLRVAIDNTPAITYTFVAQDFIDAATGFTTVAKNTLGAWASVINRKVPGLTAVENDGRIDLVSNAGVKTNAAIEILNGTLIAVRMFPGGKVEGKARDYTVDRNTSQIRLETVLQEGDRLSIGSPNTRSFIESSAIPATTTAATAEAWFSVDGDAVRIPLGISGSSPLTISVVGLHDWGHLLKISTATPAFINVREGDWMVAFDPNLSPSLTGNLRVAEVERNALTGAVIGTWITVERRSAVVARAGHRSVSLQPASGNLSKVLITGGFVRSYNVNLSATPYTEGTTSAVEIYNPNSKLSAPVASLTRTRAYHTATLLNDGRVLVTGGVSTDGKNLTSTEIYTPNTDTWTGGPSLPRGVSHHTATKLASGDVLLLGGYEGSPNESGPIYSGMACRFNAGSDTITNFTAGTPLGTPRAEHRAVLLGTGSVLVMGGLDNGGTLRSCEIYNAAAPSTTPASPMTVARRDFGATIYGTTPLVVGNFRGSLNCSTYETYNVGSNVWTMQGQLDATRFVFFESNDLVAGSGNNRYAMNCWYYDDNGIKTPAIYHWNGSAWTGLDYNPLNTDSHTFHEKQWVEVHTSDLLTKDQLIGVGGYSGGDLEVVGQVEWYNATDDEWPSNVIDLATTETI